MNFSSIKNSKSCGRGSSPGLKVLQVCENDMAHCEAED